MGYRFLILNTDYPEFLRWLYAKHPGVEKHPYEEQMWVRTESLPDSIIPLSFKALLLEVWCRQMAGPCPI